MEFRTLNGWEGCEGGGRAVIYKTGSSLSLESNLIELSNSRAVLRTGDTYRQTDRQTEERYTFEYSTDDK
jgi:hypothetical protein